MSCQAIVGPERAAIGVVFPMLGHAVALKT